MRSNCICNIYKNHLTSSDIAIIYQCSSVTASLIFKQLVIWWLMGFAAYALSSLPHFFVHPRNRWFIKHASYFVKLCALETSEIAQHEEIGLIALKQNKKKPPTATTKGVYMCGFLIDSAERCYLDLHELRWSRSEETLRNNQKQKPGLSINLSLSPSSIFLFQRQPFEWFGQIA